MTTELVPAETLKVTDDQKRLIKTTLAPDATDVELELFFYDNRRRGVHPLDRLIHFTKRNGRYVPITSIHFMRAKADEGGRAGQDQPVFAGKPGNTDYECAVTVYKMVQGEKVPYIGVAKWKEYYPGDAKEGFMWRKMESHMLAKCAEANALRLGFPRELAGLHIEEEVHVLDEPTVTAPTEQPVTLKERLKAKVEETNTAQGEQQGTDYSAHTEPTTTQQATDSPAPSVSVNDCYDKMLNAESPKDIANIENIFLTLETTQEQRKKFHDLKQVAIKRMGKK